MDLRCFEGTSIRTGASVLPLALLFALTAGLTGCSKGVEKQYGAGISLSDKSNEIINGVAATGTEGWAGTVVGIGTKDSEGYTVTCTGTLINETTIVTAAHCVLRMSSETYVVFGLNEMGVGVQGRRIVKSLANDKFSPWFPEDSRDVFDIGLAQFEGGLPAGYHPAEVLPDDSALVDNADVVLAGFGVTDGRFQMGSGTLRYTTVKIHDAKYGTSEIDTDESASGSCNGDSGGPGLINVNGKFYLWGTTSRGDSACARQGVYTKITAYKDWITNGLATWKNPPPVAPEDPSAELPSKLPAPTAPVDALAALF